MVITILLFNDSEENAVNPLKADPLHMLQIHSYNVIF